MGEAKRRRNNPTASVAALAKTSRAVFVEAYQRTGEALERHDANIVQALLETYKGRNFAIDMALRQFHQMGGAACGEGCHACCHQVVMCDPFEALNIAKYILERKDKAFIDKVLASLRALAPLPLDANARYGADKPCPLLENGRCSIYEVRPRPCRTVLSGSREACDACLAGKETPIPYIMDGIQIASSLNLGIQLALSSRKRLEVEPVELTRSLLLALEDFDKTAAMWLMGHDPFASCRVERPPELSDLASAQRFAKELGIT